MLVLLQRLRQEEEKRLEVERAKAAEEAARRAEEETRLAQEKEERRRLEQERELGKLKAEEEARLLRLQQEQGARDAQEQAAALAAAAAAQNALSRVQLDNGEDITNDKSSWFEIASAIISASMMSTDCFSRRILNIFAEENIIKHCHEHLNTSIALHIMACVPTAAEHDIVTKWIVY